MHALLVLGLLDPSAVNAAAIVADETVVPLRDPFGRVVQRRRYALHGIPLRGAVETTVSGREGPRTVLAERPTAAPEVHPEAARIPSSAVASWVREGLGLARAPALEHAPTLVYVLVLGQPVLAWEAQLALVLDPEPTRKRVWISAMSGRLLGEVEQVRSSRARVFAENPSRTPTPIEVTLTQIHAEGPGVVLESDSVRSFNCVSEEPSAFEPWRRDGECYPAHSVQSDTNGDFYVALPDVLVPEDSRDADDPFAELSMYYHAERFIAAMQQKGVEAFKCTPATLVANVRKLAPGERLGFLPLDNAYYTDQCDPERGATMMFGQGSAVDFGYDGDVVYHELGHGMVSLLTPDGLAGRRLRADASVVDAGAMNEAIADYFAFMLTGDPELAEYVGRFWPDHTLPYIRSGENQKRCPDDLTGEVHNDGEPFQAALWTSRVRVGEAMDDIVLAMLPRLAGDATFEEGAEAVLATAGEWRDAGRITDEDLATIDRAFRSRGLTACPRVVEAGPATTHEMSLRRRTTGVQPYFPGPVQLRVRVPDGGTSLRLSYRLPRGASHGVRVLVKDGEDPIAFEGTIVAIGDPGDASGTVGRIREVTRVSGDWDSALRAEPVGDDVYEATLTGLAPGRVVHLAFATEATAEQRLTDIRVRVPGVPEDDDEGDASWSEDDGSGSGDRSEAVYGDGAVAGGCGCRSGGGGAEAVPGLLAPFVPFVLLGSPRRRRGRPS